MRGAKVETQGMFSHVSLEQRVPQDHPLRAIRTIVDRSLAEIDCYFSTMYSTFGRPSIPPEFLLRALLLQIFYSIRSERQLIEQLNYNVLFLLSDNYLVRSTTTTMAGKTRRRAGVWMRG